DRDLSWKRLLKEVVNLGKTYQKGAVAITELFKTLDAGSPIIPQLNSIIKDYLSKNKNKNWKFYFIKYPILFNSCNQHYIKVFGDINEDEYIYCLNKTKYNKEADYDFMSLILWEELNKKNVDIDKIEFGFQPKYDQFGINKIKGKSVKIMYNTPEQRHKFTIKAHGQDEIYEKSITNVLTFIIENYLF